MVVEADRGGDHLFDPAGVLPADVAVTRHELGPLVEREVVPVVLRAAPLAHRVKRDVLVVGDRRVEFALDVPAESLLEVGVVLGEVVVGDVPGDLRDGDVRRLAVGEAGERRGLEAALECREVVERRAEVDREQVGFDDVLTGAQVRPALLDRSLALALRRVAPGVPVDGPELV